LRAPVDEGTAVLESVAPLSGDGEAFAMSVRRRGVVPEADTIHISRNGNPRSFQRKARFEPSGDQTGRAGVVPVRVGYDVNCSIERCGACPETIRPRPTTKHITDAKTARLNSDPTRRRRCFNELPPSCRRI
jgi:hypothetical protein